MSQALIRLRSRRPVTWRTVLGLVLVPLTVAGVLLWGLWNPAERLNTMTAAIVNLDEPVELDGQLVPMGRVLAAELIGDTSDENFTWVLTDASDAASGLDDGRYGTVITIPENFSSAATSLSRGVDEAETATIDIATSDQGRLLDPALSTIVTSTATAVLNEQLGAQFVGNIFVGFTELGTGIGEAADGAAQLADGANQLADGGAQLATGAEGLASGTAQLSDGVAQLSAGSAPLVSGGAELLTGANQLAAGARTAAAGGDQLATGLAEYAVGVDLTITGLQDGMAGTLPMLLVLRGAVESDAVAPFVVVGSDPAVNKFATLAAIDAAIAGFQDAANPSPDNPINQLKQAGTPLAQGARASADGQAQLATGLEAFASGLAGYTGGVAQYAGGVDRLAAGTPALAAGAAQLADGARQAAEGQRLAAGGASDLAAGLDTAANGIPAYTDTERETLAETAVAPVRAEGGSDELFNAAGVPLFAGIALWAGALAASLVIAPLWRRARDAARGVVTITLRSALPIIGIGAVQGAIAGAVLPVLLGYSVSQGLGFFALALTAGIAFALVTQGLSALLHGFGRFLAFVVLVVAFTIGVISTAPPLLQGIGDASPLGALFAGFQAVIGGTGGTGAAIWALALWGLGGLVLTGFAVARARRAAVAE